MRLRILRSLELMFIGLLVLMIMMVESTIRPHLPERPFSMLLLVPLALILLGALLFPLTAGSDSEPETPTVRRLKISAITAFGLAPFFVWQFRLYEQLYFLSAGFVFLLALQIYLISLAQLVEKRFVRLRRFSLARISRFAGISVTPFMLAVTVMIYLHVLQFGGAPGVSVVQSPYAVWLRITPVIRNIFGLSFLLVLTVAGILLICFGGELLSTGTGDRQGDDEDSCCN